MLILKRLLVWFVETCFEVLLLGLARVGMVGYDQHDFGKSLGLAVSAIMLLSFHYRLFVDHSRCPSRLGKSEVMVVFRRRDHVVSGSFRNCFPSLGCGSARSEKPLGAVSWLLRRIRLYVHWKHCPAEMGDNKQPNHMTHFAPWAPRTTTMSYFYEIRSTTDTVLKRDGGFASQDAAKMAAREDAKKMKNHHVSQTGRMLDASW